MATHQTAVSSTQPFCWSLAGVLKGAPAGHYFILLGGFSAYVGSDSDTWKGMIERKDLSYLNPSGVLLLEFYASHGLFIMDTMSEHRCVYKTSKFMLNVSISAHGNRTL